MHPVIENIGERFLARPFGAKDWILRAVSNDGLLWKKDGIFHFNKAPLTAQSMAYYAAMKSNDEIWFHTSVLRRGEDRWESLLTSGRKSISAREVGFRNLYSPCWCDDLLYCVAVGESGVKEIVAISGGEGVRRCIPQNWVGLSQFDGIEDVCVLKFELQWHAWVAVSREANTFITHWVSLDGQTWREQKVALESPYRSSWYQLANNPCVVRLSDGFWRMYFRTGKRPATGNVICSAISSNLVDWQHEKGERILPGGKWDHHGVGFPFVYYEHSTKLWVMYYAGFWGHSRAGEAVRKYWDNYGLELKIKLKV